MLASKMRSYTRNVIQCALETHFHVFRSGNSASASFFDALSDGCSCKSIHGLASFKQLSWTRDLRERDELLGMMSAQSSVCGGPVQSFKESVLVADTRNSKLLTGAGEFLPKALVLLKELLLGTKTKVLSLFDYSAQLPEEEFHKLADETLDHFQEKIEVYGEDLNVEGFDVDYADGVLTVRLGSLGTYVINKQTPNRQIWFSSPVSGPARFDWNGSKHAWVYRRTKAELLPLLEAELSKLLGSPITLKED